MGAACGTWYRVVVKCWLCWSTVLILESFRTRKMVMHHSLLKERLSGDSKSMIASSFGFRFPWLLFCTNTSKKVLTVWLFVQKAAFITLQNEHIEYDSLVVQYCTVKLNRDCTGEEIFSHFKDINRYIEWIFFPASSSIVLIIHISTSPFNLPTKPIP